MDRVAKREACCLSHACRGQLISILSLFGTGNQIVHSNTRDDAIGTPRTQSQDGIAMRFPHSNGPLIGQVP